MIIESDIAFYSAQTDGAKSDYMRKWRAGEGTFNSQKIQTILGEPKEDAKHLAMDVLVMEGKYTDALDRLNEMSQNDLFLVDELLITTKQAGMAIANLNENQIAELERIRDNYAEGTVKAAAALEIAKGGRLAENILWPGMNRAGFSKQTKDALQPLLTLQAYPNPSRGEFHIGYKILEGVEKTEMVLYNSEGKTILSAQLNTKQSNGILEWNETLPAGIYEASLICDGIRIETIKIIVEP